MKIQRYRYVLKVVVIITGCVLSSQAQESKIDYEALSRENPKKFEELAKKNDLGLLSYIREKYPFPSIEDSLKKIQDQGLNSENLDQLSRSIGSEGYGNVLENQSQSSILAVGRKLKPLKEKLIQASMNVNEADPMLHARATALLRWFNPDEQIKQALFKNLEKGRGVLAMSEAIYPIFYYEIDTPDLGAKIMSRIRSGKEPNLLGAASSHMQLHSFDFPEMGKFSAEKFLKYYSEEESFDRRHFRSFARFGSYLNELFSDFEKIYQSLIVRKDVSAYDKAWFKKFLSEIPVKDNPYSLTQKERLLLKPKSSSEANGNFPKGSYGSRPRSSKPTINGERKVAVESESKHNRFPWIIVGVLLVGILLLLLKTFKGKFTS